MRPRCGAKGRGTKPSRFGVWPTTGASVETRATVTLVVQVEQIQKVQLVEKVQMIHSNRKVQLVPARLPAKFRAFAC